MTHLEVAKGSAVDAVVTHHMKPFASGVARFNELLAQKLGVPTLSIFAPDVLECEMPLLSFKLHEFGADELAAFERVLGVLERRSPFRVFLHDYRDLELERRMINSAQIVFCGNDAIAHRIAGCGACVVPAWAPGLITDQRRFEPAEVSVFSFGMAHKIQTHMFARLRELLEQSSRSYAVHISNATHETSTLEDAQLVFDEMHAIFPRGLYFMGHLSDVAVYNQLLNTTFFAAFFRGGARANNTSISSAMEQGAVVITNLDQHSPQCLVHMKNVIDINQCIALPFDPLVLKTLSVRAIETARERDWRRLVGLVQSPEAASPAGMPIGNSVGGVARSTRT